MTSPYDNHRLEHSVAVRALGDVLAETWGSKPNGCGTRELQRWASVLLSALERHEAVLYRQPRIRRLPRSHEARTRMPATPGDHPETFERALLAWRQGWRHGGPALALAGAVRATAAAEPDWAPVTVLRYVAMQVLPAIERRPPAQ